MKRMPILILLTFIIACGGYDNVETRVDDVETRGDVIETTFNEHQHHVVGDKTSQPIQQIEADEMAQQPEQQPIDHLPPQPRTGRIAFESGGEIFLINTDGTERTNITQHGSTDRYPKWSPDGQQIAFLSSRAGGWLIFTMNPDGTDLQLTWKSERGNLMEITEFDWSPDMQTFIYTPHGGIFIHDTPNQIHWHPDGKSPAWSSRGQIAFVAGGQEAENQEDIYVTNQFGGAIEPVITTFQDDDKRPAWSNDGTLIAFDNSWNIFIANADGTAKRQLTLNQNVGIDRYEAPTWSPDSKQIAFAAHREPDWNWEIYIINADGTGQRNLTNNATTGERFPDWQP